MSLVVLRRWTFAIFAQTNIKNEVDDVIYETFYFDYICFCNVATEQRKYLAQDPKGEFMMVADKKIKVDDKLCYQMKQLTFWAMAAKRFTVEECEPINRVKFSDWFFFRLFD